MSSAGASILGLGYLLPLCYLLWSLKYGRRASENPWHATGLEWTAASPTVTHNFETTPEVDEPAYNYVEPHAELEVGAGEASKRRIHA